MVKIGSIVTDSSDIKVKVLSKEGGYYNCVVLDAGRSKFNMKVGEILNCHIPWFEKDILDGKMTVEKPTPIFVIKART